MPVPLTRALGLVKQAADETNMKLGVLDWKLGEAIAQARRRGGGGQARTRCRRGRKARRCTERTLPRRGGTRSEDEGGRPRLALSQLELELIVLSQRIDYLGVRVLGTRLVLGIGKFG
jgi:hypothetical protein